jgi:hypothetical protein
MTDATVTPGRFARYVAFWNEREPATALALLRIAIGCVLAYDLIYLACLDLELTIFGDAAEYNMGYTRSLDVQPLVREVFGPGPLAVHVAVYGGIAAAGVLRAGAAHPGVGRAGPRDAAPAGRALRRGRPRHRPAACAWLP